MAESEKFIVFLCSSAAKAEKQKLSFRVATRLEMMGLAVIGNLQNLSEQHSSSEENQKRMIFINDCRSGCVNILTQGFQKAKYLFFDVSPFAASKEFDIEEYIHSEILPTMNEKWNYSCAEPDTV